jgi:hypothetical protein
MLSRSFLTARKLGLSEKEHGALVSLLHMMERGELTYVNSVKNEANVHKPSKFDGLFNMASYWSPVRGKSCKTAACIAGSCDSLFGTNFVEYSLCGELGELFAPGCVDQRSWKNITLIEAAQALSNFLTTGEARWEEIFGVSNG